MAAELGSKDKKKRYDALLDRDGDACFWCFEKFSDRNPYTLDHLTPRVRGGSNQLDNLVLACFWCNGRRSDMPAGEFRRWLSENLIPLEERLAVSHYSREIRKTVQRRAYAQSLRAETLD